MWLLINSNNKAKNRNKSSLRNLKKIMIHNLICINNNNSSITIMGTKKILIQVMTSTKIKDWCQKSQKRTIWLRFTIIKIINKITIKILTMTYQVLLQKGGRFQIDLSNQSLEIWAETFWIATQTWMLTRSSKTLLK